MENDLNKLLQWASERSEELLSPLENRWLHVQGVVNRAHCIENVFSEDEKIYLLAAAYLHDIGYAPSLQKTGFHPIDGAAYLRSCNQERLASLVAYHSEPLYEARLRGLETELAQFYRESSTIADVLTYCDMTTNSIGEQVSFQERLSDIFSRYDEKHIVHQAIKQAVPALTEDVQRTESFLRIQGLLV